MKKIGLLTVSVMLIFASYAYAVFEFDGSCWKQMGEGQKTIYLFGLYDAFTFYETIIQEIENPANAKYQYYIPATMRIPDVIKELDNFYTDNKNDSVNIPDALRAIKMKSGGESNQVTMFLIRPAR